MYRGATEMDHLLPIYIITFYLFLIPPFQHKNKVAPLHKYDKHLFLDALHGCKYLTVMNFSTHTLGFIFFKCK